MRILPSTTHRAPVPDQNAQGEAGTSFQVGRRFGQEAEEVDSDENMEIVDEVEKLAEQVTIH